LRDAVCTMGVELLSIKWLYVARIRNPILHQSKCTDYNNQTEILRYSPVDRLESSDRNHHSGPKSNDESSCQYVETCRKQSRHFDDDHEGYSNRCDETDSPVRLRKMNKTKSSALQFAKTDLDDSRTGEDLLFSSVKQSGSLRDQQRNDTLAADQFVSEQISGQQRELNIPQNTRLIYKNDHTTEDEQIRQIGVSYSPFQKIFTF